MQGAIEFLADIFPLFMRWVGIIQSKGGDPKAELEAMIAAADKVADEVEKAKFG